MCLYLYVNCFLEIFNYGIALDILKYTNESGCDRHLKNIPWIHKHYKHELNIKCGLSATVVCLNKMCFRNQTVSLLYHQKPLANFGIGKTMVFCHLPSV